MDKDEAKKQLDLQAKKVLKCLDKHGVANITEIKTRTGEEKHVVGYRLEKMEEMGLVNIEFRERENNVGEIRWAHLSDKGRTLIQQGLLLDLEKEKEKQEPMFDEDKIEHIENRCDNIEMRLNTVIDDLSKMNKREGELEEMEDEIEEIQGEVEELRNWLGEWTDTQEKYLDGIKNMMEEKFDENLEDYL